MRASGRSILLITRITGSRASSALRRTNRVCGSGPSQASTSSSTPSTIVSPRSTSPPKSAWPGRVDDVQLDVAVRTAVFLARIVMPFSRSRSIESSTRSATCWSSRNAPDCHSSASTSVVLPWSTWATIARLRMSCESAGHRRQHCRRFSRRWSSGARAASAGRQAGLPAAESRSTAQPSPIDHLLAASHRGAPATSGRRRERLHVHREDRAAAPDSGSTPVRRASGAAGLRQDAGWTRTASGGTR